jgi:hypothetical protein
LPTHTVGFSSFSLCLTWRFILVVILLSSVFSPFLSKEHTRLATTVKASNHHMRLSSLFYADAAIVAGHKQRIAVFADSTFILSWQTNSCRHSYFPSSLHVSTSKLRIFSARFLSLLKENLYPLFGYLFCSGVHF